MSAVYRPGHRYAGRDGDTLFAIHGERGTEFVTSRGTRVPVEEAERVYAPLTPLDTVPADPAERERDEAQARWVAKELEKQRDAYKDERDAARDRLAKAERACGYLNERLDDAFKACARWRARAEEAEQTERQIRALVATEIEAEHWRQSRTDKDAAPLLRAAQIARGASPRRLTEQEGGIPNDAYTADDYPKGM